MPGWGPGFIQPRPPIPIPGRGPIPPRIPIPGRGPIIGPRIPPRIPPRARIPAPRAALARPRAKARASRSCARCGSVRIRSAAAVAAESVRRSCSSGGRSAANRARTESGIGRTAPTRGTAPGPPGPPDRRASARSCSISAVRCAATPRSIESSCINCRGVSSSRRRRLMIAVTPRGRSASRCRSIGAPGPASGRPSDAPGSTGGPRGGQRGGPTGCAVSADVAPTSSVAPRKRRAERDRAGVGISSSWVDDGVGAVLRRETPPDRRC
ncbi:MAG: hypothetical protein RLZZ467_1235 [Gemmatimonadota bacterium]